MSRCIGGGHRRPESNAAPGPAHSMMAVLKTLSTGAFHYEALDDTTSVAVGNSSQPPLEDHHLVECGCGSFLESSEQLRGRNRSKVSGLKGGGIDETPDAGFLFGLLASYERLRESIPTTNLNVYDLFVGNQILFLMTASAIPKAQEKTASPGSSKRLARVPLTSFPGSRGCHSNAC